MNKEKWLLVDGMALLFRHYFATAVNQHFMKNSQGIATNGVQGFVRHIYSAIDLVSPSHVAVFWDMGQHTFRNDLYDGYKSNRQAPPEELRPQFSLVKSISQQLGFYNLGQIGYEADDCIGTVAKQLSQENQQVVIVSGDKDLLQLLDAHIEVWLIKKGFTEYNIYTQQKFYEEKGIQPQQFIDVKALMGDTSDGYPGVKGIGEKTAFKLIQQYDNIDNLIQHIDDLTKGQQSKIRDNLEDLYLSHQLAKIATDVEIDINKSQAIYVPMINHKILIDNELKVAYQYLQKNFN